MSTTAATRTCLRASNLPKAYGSTVALDGLDLEVRPGEVHGLLGPNGAGKTTTIRILLGLLRHDGGEVSVLGQDPWQDAVELHHRIAYVPGDVELWPRLSGGEAIDLLTHLRGGAAPRRRQELVERFDLDVTKKGRTYSKGNRQKVAIVAALATDSELLILDQPTAGLDPLMEAVFKQYIREAKAEGRTVLLSSRRRAHSRVHPRISQEDPGRPPLMRENATCRASLGGRPTVPQPGPCRSTRGRPPCAGWR